MMIFNPNRMFALRGIDKPYRFLVNNGFGSTTASDLINIRKPLVRTEYLERLCLLLNCTPNDLYEWKPDNNVSIAENHPLKALEKAEMPPQMSELIKDIPVEKLSEVQNMLRGLKNQE
jgi:DNA-binding Xre family transcriptional regulator